MAPHDNSYKLLFSHQRMVRDLLEGFVHEDWIAHLDFASLEKVSDSYVTDDLRSRADDMVWKVRCGGNWVYLYLLLEFQSKVEPYMAVRILTYEGLLYQDLIRTKRLLANRTLPPVFPIVLYNGEDHWGAATKVSALLTPVRRSLRRYAPQVKYLLIDEQKCANAGLTPPGNLAGLLFRLENSDNLAEANEAVGLLLECLQGPDDGELSRAFSEWIGRVLFERHSGEPLNKVVELREMHTMLANRIAEWEARAEAKGLRKGREIGEQVGELKGELKGSAAVVLEQLQENFGPLPGWVAERIHAAQVADIRRWARNLVKARSLDEVFKRADVSTAQDGR